ncbi:GTPase family protein [Naumannella halotolerans]|uniref:GTPase family protein n=1 Tax=Naumannella halotolerans TaxID=993414 RepID=UPI00370D064B
MPRTSLADRVSALQEALTAAGDRLPEPVRIRAGEVLQRAGERTHFSAEHTVVALAGQTGAGKSSVFNALVGAELAATSSKRPTTAHPIGVVAETAALGAGAGDLLDWLGVSERHDLQVDRAHPDGLVLLDLPDHDSVVADHRLRADHVTERADLLIWVTNPQKYADATLHTRYLQRLTGRDEVIVVVLNQLDRLQPAEQRACLDDLRRLVAADGLRATVVGTSAVTGQGIEELTELIARAVRRREAATARLVAEVRAAAAAIEAELAAPSTGGGVLTRSRDQLLTAMEHAAGVPAVVEAVRVSSIRDAVAATGWPPLRWVQKLRADPLATLGLRPSPDQGASTTEDLAELRRTSLPTASPAVTAQIATAARGYVAAASASLPPALGEQVNARVVAATGSVADALDSTVARSVRIRRAPWWPVAGAFQWLFLAVAVLGGLWLGGLALLDYLRFDIGDGALPLVQVGEFGIPVPTLMLVGGVLAGLLLALISRWCAGIGAARRARRVRRELRRGVEEVASRLLLGEVETELTALQTARAAAARAAR